MTDEREMRGRPEAAMAAAVLNATLVLFVPLAYVWFVYSRLDVRLGATINAPVLGRSALMLLPLAALAAWRTWAHAERWRARQPTVLQPVAEAAVTAVVVALVFLAPGMLINPHAAPAYAIAYGAGALILGAIVGLILRTTAVLMLMLYGWMFADDSAPSHRGTAL